jgi:hypothetical protein
LPERAAAVLQVADGLAVEVVAREGLLRLWDRHALNAWLRSFEADGVAGLTMHPGRGRKPAFSPSATPSPRRKLNNPSQPPAPAWA